MIVECAGCSTRFRLADEKIPARGARVRCSRCGATFRVEKPGAGLPARDEPSIHEAPTRVEPLAGLGAAAEEVGDGALRPAGPGAPFGAIAGPTAPGAFLAASAGPPAEPTAADSFADVTFGPSEPSQPAAATDSFEDVTFGPGVPTAPSFTEPAFEDALPGDAGEDPHHPGSPPEPEAFDRSGLAVDFGFLRSPGPEAAPGPAPAAIPADDPLAGAGLPPPPVRPPPLPSTRAQAVEPAPAPEPSLELDLDGAWKGAAVDVSPAWPTAAPARPADPPGPFDPGAIDLDPAPFGGAPASGGAAPFGGAPVEPAVPVPPPPGGADLAGTDEPAFARAPAAPRPQPPGAPPAGAIRLGVLRPAAGAAQARRPAAQQAGGTAARRGGAIRHALPSVAILLAALAIFVVARNGAFRLDPASIAAAFGLGPSTHARALVPLRTKTGRYPTAAGELLYAHGAIANHADAEMGPAIRVVAELLDGERVVARAVTWAGGRPSPEEVHALGSPEAWSALAARGAARWALPLAPGAEAPWFAVLGPVPEGVERLRLRVAADAAPPPPAPEAIPDAQEAIAADAL